MPVNLMIWLSVFSVSDLTSQVAVEAGGLGEWGDYRAPCPVEPGGELWLASNSAVSDRWGPEAIPARLAGLTRSEWTVNYQRRAMAIDGLCALLAGFVTYCVRLDELSSARLYLIASCLLPLAWLGAIALMDGYDARLIGVGSDEFRRVLNAGLALMAGVAIISYVAKAELARGYVLIAFPLLTVLDLAARYELRKRLHRMRSLGVFMQKVVVAGYPDVVTDMTMQLRRDCYHGLDVVAACLPAQFDEDEISGIPAVAGLDHVAAIAHEFGADTVAVLSCPELSGMRLRELAWELEKTGTSLCVAPAILDIGGPRTSIRPAAGMPLLYMDHPEFTGIPRLVKSVFDRALALLALGLLSPLMAAIAIMIKIGDGGSILFSQVRVGVDGSTFRIYKFRTMVQDAEALKVKLAEQNEAAGVLFKMRRDPRITAVGAWLRRWSLDELPQLFNVVLGDMSLVGPRPALPEETDQYHHHMRRRLVVKPGITGLWQVSGRSDLSWDEAVRLDLSYVENWSLMLDLQILWKTWAAIKGGAGAY
jgi:exopolysaccharide biosynthesis polyprenyl glycosylphosphotransferase